MTIWHGSKPECDFCKLNKLPNGITDIFYDAATVSGPWACMCRMHFLRFGRPRGQEYHLLANEWHKVRDLKGDKA